MYGYAFSLFLVAVGALLRYAVTTSTNGFDFNVAGAILMVVGAVGLVFTFGARLLDHDEYVKPTNVIDDDPLRPVRRRRWYR